MSEYHDLGAGHFFNWVGPYNEEDQPYPTRADGVKVSGIIEWHWKPGHEGAPIPTDEMDNRFEDWCGGAVLFVRHINPSEREAARPIWTVESLEPLTLSPSILCSLDKGGCGSHGYIREGRWVGA